MLQVRQYCVTEHVLRATLCWKIKFVPWSSFYAILYLGIVVDAIEYIDLVVCAVEYIGLVVNAILYLGLASLLKLLSTLT